MSSAPADLAALRVQVMVECGFTNPVEVGIVADSDHLENGGYHCGCGDINSIGRYNSATKDYSVRQARDRLGTGSNVASAMDIGDNWPRGGRAAWLRFNQLLRGALGAGDSALAAMRAINYLNSASQKRRFDTLTMTESASADSVDIHTHVEWWRNTSGSIGRAASCERLLELIRAARDGTTAAKPVPREDDEMTLYQVTGVPANTNDIVGAHVPEFGVMQAYPDGPLNVDAGEWASIAGQSPMLIKCSWPRLLARCAALAPAPIDVDALAQGIADATPDDAVTSAVVLEAIQQPAAVAVFRDAAEYAQDH